jgi:metal-responsive CopG/Arc/MetJ family transcriptional regulator
MQPKRPQRRTITIDLPSEQVSWLDRHAAISLISRSGFVRQLIARAMRKELTNE